VEVESNPAASEMPTAYVKMCWRTSLEAVVVMDRPST
jgi:hypothetical protein